MANRVSSGPFWYNGRVAISPARRFLAAFGNSMIVVRPSLGRFAKRDAAVFRAIEFIFTRATGMSLREWRETCKNGATASTCPIS